MHFRLFQSILHSNILRRGLVNIVYITSLNVELRSISACISLPASVYAYVVLLIFMTVMHNDGSFVSALLTVVMQPMTDSAAAPPPPAAAAGAAL